MNKEQYTKAIERLGLTPYAAGPVLAISRRHSQRYASGESPVDETVARLLVMLQKYGIPKEWTHD